MSVSSPGDEFNPAIKGTIPDNLLFGSYGRFPDAVADINSMKRERLEELAVLLSIFPSASDVPETMPSNADVLESQRVLVESQCASHPCFLLVFFVLSLFCAGLL